MSKVNVCDRCSKQLTPGIRGLIGKKIRFVLAKPTKDGFHDMWRLNQHDIELCDTCTSQFMEYAKPKGKPGRKKKIV